jgi:hypothetical protein
MVIGAAKPPASAKAVESLAVESLAVESWAVESWAVESWAVAGFVCRHDRSWGPVLWRRMRRPSAVPALRR